MRHETNCCESVDIDDICGNLEDLNCQTVIEAEKITNSDKPKDEDPYDSCTWTFYKIRTGRSEVTIRWYGSSNGYYSEEVSFFKYVEKE
jgi:hypothetical protein